jgi:hypothetical protein
VRTGCIILGFAQIGRELENLFGQDVNDLPLVAPALNQEGSTAAIERLFLTWFRYVAFMLSSKPFGLMPQSHHVELRVLTVTCSIRQPTLGGLSSCTYQRVLESVMPPAQTSYAVFYTGHNRPTLIPRPETLFTFMFNNPSTILQHETYQADEQRGQHPGCGAGSGCS